MRFRSTGSRGPKVRRVDPASEDATVAGANVGVGIQMAASLLIEAGPVVSLIAATPALLDAEEDGGAVIAAGLGVEPPVDWPPEHNDPATREWMRELLEDFPEEPGYGTWYIIAHNRLVGVCGFKGPPNGDGEVVIGYSMVEAEQRKGVAAEAARMLVQRAFRDPRVAVVVAETLPALVGSQKVLVRNGFTHVGGYMHSDEGQVMRFETRKPS
jgi:ribosomal-protein-alanine N-acetyltransferase